MANDRRNKTTPKTPSNQQPSKPSDLQSVADKLMAEKEDEAYSPFPDQGEDDLFKELAERPSAAESGAVRPGIPPEMRSERKPKQRSAVIPGSIPSQTLDQMPSPPPGAVPPPIPQDAQTPQTGVERTAPNLQQVNDAKRRAELFRQQKAKRREIKQSTLSNQPIPGAPQAGEQAAESSTPAQARQDAESQNLMEEAKKAGVNPQQIQDQVDQAQSKRRFARLRNTVSAVNALRKKIALDMIRQRIQQAKEALKRKIRNWVLRAIGSFCCCSPFGIFLLIIIIVLIVIISKAPPTYNQ